MTKYIDVDNYCENICNCAKDKCDKEKCPILTAPAANVVEVKHGKWDERRYAFCSVCSACGAIVERGTIKWQSGELNYCPNGGAKQLKP